MLPEFLAKSGLLHFQHQGHKTHPTSALALQVSFKKKVGRTLQSSHKMSSDLWKNLNSVLYTNHNFWQFAIQSLNILKKYINLVNHSCSHFLQ